MKCPYCKYVSFEHLTSCRKCSKDLAAHKHQHGIDFVQPLSLGIVAFLQASPAPGGQSFDAMEFDSDAVTIDIEESGEDSFSTSTGNDSDTDIGIGLTDNAPVTLSDSDSDIAFNEPSSGVVIPDPVSDESASISDESVEDLLLKDITSDDAQALDESGFSLQLGDHDTEATEAEDEANLFADSGFSLQLGEDDDLGFDTNEGIDSTNGFGLTDESTESKAISDSSIADASEPVEINFDAPDGEISDFLADDALEDVSSESSAETHLVPPVAPGSIPEMPTDSNQFLIEDDAHETHANSDESIEFELVEEDVEDPGSTAGLEAENFDNSVDIQLEENTLQTDEQTIEKDDFSDIDLTSEEKELFGDDMLANDDNFDLEDLDLDLDDDLLEK